MTIVKNKAAVILVTMALLVCALLPSGCSLFESKDVKAVKAITEQFIEGYGSGDKSQFADLINGSFAYKIEGNECMARAASKTKLVKFNSVTVDPTDLTAKADIVISIVNASELAQQLNGKVSSSEEYLSIIDSFDKMHEETLSFDFLYDKRAECWTLKKESANYYEDLLYKTHLMTVTTVLNIYEGFAAGEFNDGLYEGYYFDCFSLSPVLSGYSGDMETCEAIYRFATSYFQTILKHGITISLTSSTFKVKVDGLSPSKTAILDYFKTDDYIIEAYKIFYKARTSEYDYDELWYQLWVDTHLDLAKQIPDMDCEIYSVEVTIDPESEDPRMDTVDDIFPILQTEAYDSIMDSDSNFNYSRKAVEALYNDNEITKEQYDGYMIAIDRDNDPHRDTRYDFIISDYDVVWEGTENHKNQATDVVEYIPDSSYGDIFYGLELPQRSDDGTTMAYSKQPGWLKTAGYCIGDDGITVMLLVDYNFAKDTVLEYEWTSNDTNRLESGEIAVAEDGQSEFEFTIKGAEIKADAPLIFRLWEQGHKHVVAYVKLSQT